jgi:outer membrane protein TolC
MPAARLWIVFSILLLPRTVKGQVVTLADAVEAAACSNRTIRTAELQREKAVEDLRIAGTHRLPIFSLTTLASQPITLGGVTIDRGALGVYPAVGPIPGTTTTLESALHFGVVFYGSVAQPLTQQHRIGLGIDLARVGVEAAAEQIRTARQATTNEVRRLYSGIVQAESARKQLQATVAFLEQLNRETRQNVLQRVALEADLLGAGAQLAQAKYELLKLEDPIQTQKQQLNRLMGRDVDTPFDVDPASVTYVRQMSLEEAYATALESRPEIRSAKLKVRQAELERRIKSAERIPDVSLSLTGFKTLNFSSVLPNNISSVGLQATWDVFDWGRKRKEIDAGHDSEVQAALGVKEAEALIRIDVAHHHRRVLEAQQEVDVAKAMHATGTESLRVVRNRYAQREALLSDVLKVQSTLAEADHRLVQALMDLASEQADFDKAVGIER